LCRRAEIICHRQRHHVIQTQSQRSHSKVLERKQERELHARYRAEFEGCRINGVSIFKLDERLKQVLRDKEDAQIREKQLKEGTV
jgi:hypothetical protein